MTDYADDMVSEEKNDLLKIEKEFEGLHQGQQFSRLLTRLCNFCQEENWPSWGVSRVRTLLVQLWTVHAQNLAQVNLPANYQGEWDFDYQNENIVPQRPLQFYEHLKYVELNVFDLTHCAMWPDDRRDLFLDIKYKLVHVLNTLYFGIATENEV